MRELLDTIDSWRRQGKQVALATVVAVEGSTPRATGAKMVLTPDGDLAGSVSGGCVEADVFEQACEVVASGTPKLVRYGFSGDAVFEIGLACGGAIQVFIEPPACLATVTYDRLAQALRDNVPVGEVTVMSGSRSVGAKMLVFLDGSQHGALGLVHHRAERAGEILAAIADVLAAREPLHDIAHGQHALANGEPLAQLVKHDIAREALNMGLRYIFRTFTFALLMELPPRGVKRARGIGERVRVKEIRGRADQPAVG